MIEIMIGTVGVAWSLLRSNFVGETQTNLAWETLLDISSTRAGALHLRLAAAIRTAVHDGRLPLGSALPPSRGLAADLNVSRWAVTQAYGHLVTEGYLSGRRGSATRVCWSPASDRGHDHGPGSTGTTRPVRFDLGKCAFDYRNFPRHKWVESIRAVTDTVQHEQLGYSEPGGEKQLRSVLAEHLNRSRAARVTLATISVFSGAGQAMTQVSRALVAAGHTHLGVEDPGSGRLLQAARTAGLQPVPIPVDGDGLVVDALTAHPHLRAVCTGPPHQVVTGCTLAPHRRRALLAWAHRVDGLVIEDDYDSEFSYDNPIPPVMQGTDPDRVILLGSMTMTLTPTVNVGWAVTPTWWTASVRADAQLPLGPPALTQLALAHFMRSGAHYRHLRSSRQRLRARRAGLIAAIRRELPGLDIQGAHAGQHFVVELPVGADVTAIVTEAKRHDLRLCDANDARIVPAPDDTRLQIGYGNLNDSLVDEAVAVLAQVIAKVADHRMASRGSAA
jgi:GntR family transcriptional regulator/MocR family aminotransferase